MAVYSSLCTISAVQLFFGIFIDSVCLCLKWGLLTFTNFKGFPYVQQPPLKVADKWCTHYALLGPIVQYTVGSRQ